MSLTCRSRLTGATLVLPKILKPKVIGAAALLTAYNPAGRETTSKPVGRRTHLETGSKSKRLMVYSVVLSEYTNYFSILDTIRFNRYNLQNHYLRKAPGDLKKGSIIVVTNILLAKRTYDQFKLNLMILCY